MASKGLFCARDIVATAALRGQVHLAEQLTRSQSAFDVREPTGRRAARAGEVEEEVEVQEIRTWTGVYDDRGRIIEQAITEIADEEIVVVEDPDQPSSHAHRRSTHSTSTSSSQRRSRSRTGGPSDPDTQSIDYNTLPRRSSRRAASGSQY